MNNFKVPSNGSLSDHHLGSRKWEIPKSQGGLVVITHSENHPNT